MVPRKLSVYFAFFCYTGNSTGTSLVWDVADWWGSLVKRLHVEDKFKDRIGNIYKKAYADTPITMTRNLAVQDAREHGADILIMVDSDMKPDVNLHMEGQEPFFDVAFDAIYEHFERGPLVIAAPYGGCPPHENMFVFTWTGTMNGGDESPIELRQYNREEAASMAGLHEAAALPTGLIAYDVRSFDYIKPPYFEYEWTDEFASQKASTEDVQNTRDISLAVIQRLGYNPLRCAWNCWAGHYKVWLVNKPLKYTADMVSERLADAVRKGRDSRERTVDMTFVSRLPENGREVSYASANGK